MEKHVTLRDIAKVTGVHFTTVGLALRNDSHVNPATAAKVHEAARQLGYTHNAMLSALSAYRHGNSPKFKGVLAYLATYSPEDLKTNLTEQQLRAGVSAYAQSQGFGFESFHLNEPGMTGAQMSRMLRARGIQGLLLPPRQPTPGPIPNLEWEQFSPLAVGYSITNLKVHRACPHHAHNMRLCLQTLRERGYRRIGLILPYYIYERTRGIVAGSFLSEQYLLPKHERVTPLITHTLTKPIVAKWLRTQRIDCIILSAFPLEICEWIRELGYDVPNEMGLSIICRFGKTDHIAGIDEQLGLIGEAAGKFVVSMLQHNERGLPAYPLYTLVEGRWVDRPTVRALPATESA